MGRDIAAKYGLKVYLVSIHAPVWGATGIGDTIADMGEVSIHAPVWGATALVVGLLRPDLVSIHAPVWGATCSVGLR